MKKNNGLGRQEPKVGHKSHMINTIMKHLSRIKVIASKWLISFFFLAFAFLLWHSFIQKSGSNPDYDDTGPARKQNFPLPECTKLYRQQLNQLTNLCPKDGDCDILVNQPSNKTQCQHLRLERCTPWPTQNL